MGREKENCRHLWNVIRRQEEWQASHKIGRYFCRQSHHPLAKHCAVKNWGWEEQKAGKGFLPLHSCSLALPS